MEATQSPRNRWALMVAGAAIAVGLSTTAIPAGAESTAPPTPTNVTAIAAGGDSPADVIFDAESGTLGDVSASTSSWVTSEARKNGNRGLRVSAAHEPAWVRWDSSRLPRGKHHASIRSWVRVQSSRPGESVDLLTVANANSSRNFDLFVTGDTGRFKWDLYRDRADESAFVVTPGRWYLVEARISFRGSSHTAEVRIDGVPQGTITSPGTDTTVSSVTVGSALAKTHAQDYDDLAVQVGDQPLGWLSGAGGGPATVDVTWSPVTDTGSGLREYQVWRNGQWYGWAPAGTTTFTDTRPATGAHYQLRAVDHDGNRSDWSGPVPVTDPDADRTPPPTPGGLALRRLADQSTRLTWNAVDDAGGSGLREYAIFRDGRWYGWVPAGTTAFLDREPVAGATYRVRAYDHALNRSGWSAPVSL